MDLRTADAVEQLAQPAPSGPCATCRGEVWLYEADGRPMPCHTCLPYGARQLTGSVYDDQRVQHIWTRRHGLVLRSWRSFQRGQAYGEVYVDIRYDNGPPGVAWVGDLVTEAGT